MKTEQPAWPFGRHFQFVLKRPPVEQVLNEQFYDARIENLKLHVEAELARTALAKAEADLHQSNVRVARLFQAVTNSKAGVPHAEQNLAMVRARGPGG